MPSTNLSFLQELYRLYTTDPPQAIEMLLNQMAALVSWSSIADESKSGLRFAKDRASKAEVSQYFEEVWKDWEPLNLEIDHFTEQDDRVYVNSEGTWKHRITGKIVTTRKVDFFRFQDGIIVEFCEFFDSGRVIEAATSD